MWKRGDLKATQLPSGTIIVDVNQPIEGVVIYARVSSSEKKSNLDSQAERLQRYCEAKGYQIVEIVKEIGSGVNDNRKKLTTILQNDNYHLIIRFLEKNNLKIKPAPTDIMGNQTDLILKVVSFND